MRHMRHIVFVTSFVLMASIAWANSPAETLPPSIAASAQGEASLTPDQATIHIAVVTKAPTATTAGKENARISTAVQDALRKAGIAMESIRTVGYTLHPDIRYERDQRRQVGYVGTHTLQVRVVNLANVGPVIDQATLAGANNIDSIQFTSTKAAEVRQEALARAVERARSDAEAMARAAGGRLGALIELSTEQLMPVPMHRMETMARMQDSATPIAPGEITVEARVQGRWTFVAEKRPE